MSVEGVRDFSIIVLAFLAIIQVTLLLVITIMVWKKIGPLMESAQHTMRHVEATTEMVSEMTVSPIIRLAGVAVGARTVIATLMKRDKGGAK